MDSVNVFVSFPVSFRSCWRLIWDVHPDYRRFWVGPPMRFRYDRKKLVIKTSSDVPVSPGNSGFRQGDVVPVFLAWKKRLVGIPQDAQSLVERGKDIVLAFLHMRDRPSAEGTPWCSRCHRRWSNRFFVAGSFCSETLWFSRASFLNCFSIPDSRFVSWAVRKEPVVLWSFLAGCILHLLSLQFDFYGNDIFR